MLRIIFIFILCIVAGCACHKFSVDFCNRNEEYKTVVHTELLYIITEYRALHANTEIDIISASGSTPVECINRLFPETLLLLRTDELFSYNCSYKIECIEWYEEEILKECLCTEIRNRTNTSIRSTEPIVDVHNNVTDNINFNSFIEIMGIDNESIIDRGVIGKFHLTKWLEHEGLEAGFKLGGWWNRYIGDRYFIYKDWSSQGLLIEVEFDDTNIYAGRPYENYLNLSEQYLLNRRSGQYKLKNFYRNFMIFSTEPRRQYYCWHTPSNRMNCLREFSGRLIITSNNMGIVPWQLIYVYKLLTNIYDEFVCEGSRDFFVTFMMKVLVWGFNPQVHGYDHPVVYNFD